MVTGERLNTLLSGANPVPDVDKIDLVEVGAIAYLATLSTRSNSLTRLDTEKTESKDKKRSGMLWLVAAAAGVIIGVSMVVAAQSTEVSPPATQTTTSTIAGASPTTLGIANSPEVNNPGGDFKLGRHSLSAEGISFSVDVSAPGWEPWIVDASTWLISKSTHGPQGAEAMIFWAGYPDGTYADLCPRWGPWPDEGALQRSPVAQVASAVATRRGVELVSGPSEVIIGGLPAQHVVVTVTEDAGCDPGFFYIWKAQTGGALWDATLLGDTIRVWIVDVDGTRLFIAGESRQSGTGSIIEQEIQQIIESIRFD